MSGQLGVQSFISKFGLDIVGIYSQGADGAPTQQILTDVNIMRASINTQSRVFRHPLADGSTIIDHRILLPIEIELAIIITNKRRIFNELGISLNVPSPSILQNNYNIFLDHYTRGTRLAIQTRASYYANLIIQALPHQETVDVYDGIVLVVRFQETQFATPTVGVFSPSDPTETDTQDRGVIQATTPTVNQQSAAAGILDSITGSLTRFYGDDN